MGKAVLLLKLAGPMQSWGTSSKFETRDTADMPTKSGVCGLVASALGRGRKDDVSDLAALKFGVRADREGVFLDDFQMVRETEFPDGMKALYELMGLYAKTGNGKIAAKDYSSVAHKHYLCDAVFLAGLEGDRDFLQEIADALMRPQHAPFLGRRGCPPAGRVFYGIRDGSLRDVLESEPPLCKWKDASARYQMDSDNGALVRDVPASYDPDRREYGCRHVSGGYFHAGCASGPGDHDPMACLEPEQC